MPPNLTAVPTNLHPAPAAQSVSRLVKENPIAGLVSALADAAHLIRRQQVDSLVHQRNERALMNRNATQGSYPEMPHCELQLRSGPCPASETAQSIEQFSRHLQVERRRHQHRM